MLYKIKKPPSLPRGVDWPFPHRHGFDKFMNVPQSLWKRAECQHSLTQSAYSGRQGEARLDTQPGGKVGRRVLLTQIRSPGQSVERQRTRHRHRADTSKLDYAIPNNTDWASVKPSLACRTYSNLEVPPWLIWKQPFQETLEF